MKNQSEETPCCVAKGRTSRYFGYIVLIFGIFVVTAKVDGADLAAALEDALEDYCIPKCTSDCKPAFLAEYDSATGECKCGANLTYDEDLRECIVQCPAGTYAYKGVGCPGGTYASSAAACPAGAYKIGTTDEHGGMAAGTTCPAGSYKITIE
ncbi:MAG: hypothetical protein LBO78_03110 [Rickettsiales bacterium]|jgi:hypothetical protein|nr:hypothetical protein [Rickettsiales bacterium]